MTAARQQMATAMVDLRAVSGCYSRLPPAAARVIRVAVQPTTGCWLLRRCSARLTIHDACCLLPEQRANERRGRLSSTRLLPAPRQHTDAASRDCQSHSQTSDLSSMTSQHHSSGSSSTSSSPPPPPLADAEYVEPATPPARTPARGIVFTSTLPQSHKRRPHPSQVHLKPITVPHSTDATDTPIPVIARSIPRTQPSTALPPSLHRTATTTLMVVVGLGLVCAFGGVQLFRLSKDEKARKRMQRARRSTISYLDETIGGKRQMESEADRNERRRQDEVDRVEREREKKEREAEAKKAVAEGSGWRRYVPRWAQAKG